jgi:hypothetical protein
LAAAQRRLQAAELAAATADDDVGQVVNQHTDRWANDVGAESQKAKARAREALKQFEAAIVDAAELQAIDTWLSAPAPQPVRGRGPLSSTSSARSQQTGRRSTRK